MDGFYLPPKPAIILPRPREVVRPGDPRFVVAPQKPRQREAGLIIDPYTMFPAPAGSGNDAFTKILLHFDGSDASTTFTDDNAGGSAHTWTAGGNAQLDTGITPKFGTAAGLFDGTGDYVTTPDHADFTLGSSDFTADCWFNRAGGDGTTRFLFGQSNNAATAGISIFANLQGSNVMRVGASADGTAIPLTTISTAATFLATGWHHLAFVRSGNTLKLFIDGTQEGVDTPFAGTIFDSSNAWGIGSLGELTSLTWNGSIDEFRLSVGTARWTTNFTPPTSAYS